jgi:sporulation protein YlmC with PRC-barrel domain
MGHREVHLELLLGRRVLDPVGKSVGRIEEVIAEHRGDECVIREYLVGSGALLYRLSAMEIGRSALRLFRAKKAVGYRVAWDQMDLTNPEKPRLNCDVSELEKFTGQVV